MTDTTNTMTVEERITTIMRDVSPRDMKGRPRRLGKLDITASPAAICAKLGKYLLGGLTVAQKDIMADALASILTDGQAKPAEFEAGTIQQGHLLGFGEVESRIYTGSDMDVVILMATPKYGRSRLGLHTWWSRRTGERRRIFSFRLDTMAGARDLLDYEHDDIAIRVCSEADSSRMNVKAACELRERALRRWMAEDNKLMNLTWSTEHSASVFEDKKHCTLTHLQAAADSEFAHVFHHVEIDDGIDLDAFHRIDLEFRTRWDAGELPAISPANQFRFRKTMRHRFGGMRAIGVYSPDMQAIAVDPRHPESLLHEFAHAYDFEHGQISLTPEFQPILDAYRDSLKNADLDDNTRRYLTTPTEVYARLAELDAYTRGIGGSFIDTENRYQDPHAYLTLAAYLPDYQQLTANIH
ncbi:hypothetical protein CSQ85_12290 [Bifidobacterium rousetti]|uniref:hypothetical protein n=1 Tax=Bifidobacterium rousetti TaxID=2045439 RepID=UPI001239DA0E|nr:hypothetical protein [Bifidobacterium rousetti]KAA8815701.1 hypothetical protein CSQ85_12290 [Bifidobacterium rousetti]